MPRQLCWQSRRTRWQNQPQWPCLQVDCYLQLDKNIPYLSHNILLEIMAANTNNMHGDFTYTFNFIGMKTLGHNELIEHINSLAGHHTSSLN